MNKRLKSLKVGEIYKSKMVSSTIYPEYICIVSKSGEAITEWYYYHNLQDPNAVLTEYADILVARYKSVKQDFV